MRRGAWGLALAGVALLAALPVALAPREGAGPPVPQLTIITPHNEQIRFEFANGFERWHAQRYGGPVRVVWLVPGGTSTIQRMLEAQYAAAHAAGRGPGGAADLLFGGGSRVHQRLARPDERSGAPAITEAVAFDEAWLKETYGASDIGGVPLYDPDQHWFGAALSGFGIMYNNDALAEVKCDAPRAWADLCNPALFGRVALADPGASGSINTAFDAIVRRHGWTEGWRILRRAGANARSLSGSAVRAPLDVASGDAAAGMTIDFYARFEAQSLMRSGYGARVGYVDPPGDTTIDPDPISVLRGAPQPQAARRFIEFCLSEQGQALWQFRAADNQVLGPSRFELRRLPIVRSMYERSLERFVDRVDPWTLVGEPIEPQPLVRPFVPVLFGAMVMDNRDELRDAWTAITRHPAYGGRRGIVVAGDIADARLKEMLALFDAMPSGLGPDGAAVSLEAPDGLERVAQGWATAALWPANAEPPMLARRRFAAYFRHNYREIVRLAGE